jgi:RNase P protein component
VKAFRFRLDQALRWRATQVDLEKSRVGIAASRLAALRAQADARARELKDQQPGTGVTGSELESLAVWRDRISRRIRELEKQAQEAERALAEQMKILVEANRKHLLLENLQTTEQARWKVAFTRELESFAGEAFLRHVTIKKRTGA